MSIIPRETKQRSIVVLGFSMVGKTAICIRFAKNRFEDQYEPTYENSWNKLYEYKGQQIEIVIKDTQGLSDQEVFRHEYGLGYHGYILVYSISSMRSLETLKGIHEKLLNLTVNTKIPRVLVGNKVDLARHAREVSYADGQALANEWGCAFVECSAKWNQGVKEVFDILLDEIEQLSEPDNGYSIINSSKCLDYLCCINRNRPEYNDNSSFQISDTKRLEKWGKIFILFSCIYGFIAIIAGIIIANSNNQTDTQLLAYIILGFGFIISLVSVLGWLGIKQTSQEFLKAYAISLFIIIITEIVAYVILYAEMSIFKDNLALATISTIIGVLIQIISVWIICGFQSSLTPQLLLQGEYPMADNNSIISNEFYDSSSYNTYHNLNDVY